MGFIFAGSQQGVCLRLAVNKFDIDSFGVIMIGWTIYVPPRPKRRLQPDGSTHEHSFVPPLLHSCLTRNYARNAKSNRRRLCRVVPAALQRMAAGERLAGAFIPYFAWEAEPSDHAELGQQIYPLGESYFSKFGDDLEERSYAYSCRRFCEVECPIDRRRKPAQAVC